MERHRGWLRLHSQQKPWGQVEDAGQQQGACWHLCTPCSFWKSQWSEVLLPTQMILACFRATSKPSEDTDGGRQRAAAADIPTVGLAKFVYCWRRRAPHELCSFPTVCGAAEPPRNRLRDSRVPTSAGTGSSHWCGVARLMPQPERRGDEGAAAAPHADSFAYGYSRSRLLVGQRRIFMICCFCCEHRIRLKSERRRRLCMLLENGPIK